MLTEEQRYELILSMGKVAAVSKDQSAVDVFMRAAAGMLNMPKIPNKSIPLTDNQVSFLIKCFQDDVDNRTTLRLFIEKFKRTLNLSSVKRYKKIWREDKEKPSSKPKQLD